MPEYFRPEIVKMREPVYGIYELRIPGTALTKNRKDIFCFLKLDKDGFTELEPIIDDYPPSGGEGLQTDPIYNLVWQREGRYIRMLEIDKKRRHGFRITGDVGCNIHSIMAIDENTLYIKMTNVNIDDGPGTFYGLYDIKKAEVIYRSPYFWGRTVPFGNNMILHNEWVTDKKKKWFLNDLHLDKPVENKLTKLMTPLKIEITTSDGRAVDIEKRIIIASGAEIKGRDVLYSITWDLELEDPKVEPAILQLPKLKGVYDSNPVISHDGSWMKVTFYQPNSPVEASRLLLYHLSSIYPQHLSLPLMGGYTQSGTPGAFMTHEEWGPLYIEQDPEAPDKLFVYRLNDGLKILAQYGAEAYRED